MSPTTTALVRERDRPTYEARSKAVPAPRISLVVPCMNSGRFLDDLLARLAAQTFRDFEIIVVDDGSTERATVDR